MVKNVHTGLYFVCYELFRNFIEHFEILKYFRHEKPSDPDDPLSHQNMRDRYYGNNDPVAEKLLTRAKALPVLQVPEDTTITTLYVGDLGPPGVIIEADLRSVEFI